MAAAALCSAIPSHAQTNNKIDDMSIDDLMEMSIDDLANLSVDELAAVVDRMGVNNVDELFAMILNKSVSSASKKSEDSFHSPLSTTVITRDEMRTYGITTIEEAFRLIPGMIVSEKTNGIYDIQMRGLANIPDNNSFLYTEDANVLLMIDGRPVQNIVMGSINFDMLSIGIEDIERIEVVRGACSALYGANAVNGVINILTERPTAESNRISGNLQMGNQDTHIGELAIRKAFNDKVSVGATVNIQYRQRPTDKIYLVPFDGQYVAAPGASLPNAEIEQVMATDGPAIFSQLSDASKGGYYSIAELERLKQIYPTYTDADGNVLKFRLFEGTEYNTSVSKMFPEPDLARRTMGLNGYVYLTPTGNTSFYISGGYQNSFVNTTPTSDDNLAMNGRKAKTAYVGLDANIYDLHIVGNFTGGPQDYSVGVPGFKMKTKNVNATAEYDFNLDCGLGIRPGFNFQYAGVDDYIPVWDEGDTVDRVTGLRSSYAWHYEDPGYDTGTHDFYDMSGFFNGGSSFTTFAPSLRLDYRHEGLRLIGAYRADKTSLPDKWTHSVQLAASYAFSNRNFVRFVYGRANRGANLVNVGSNYTWQRSGMSFPRNLTISANEDCTLMHIDNFEIGYRCRPVPNLLIDAEAFYSISKDYGAMMAEYGNLQVTEEWMTTIMTDLYKSLLQLGRSQGIEFADPSDGDATNAIFRQMLADQSTRQSLASYICLMMTSDATNTYHAFNPYASVRYSMLPYEVHQMGISLNADYVITPKVILKLNANFQQTKIDNYYEYRQVDDISAMISKAQSNAISASLKEDNNGDISDISNYVMSGEIPDLLLAIFNNMVDNNINLAPAAQKAYADALSYSAGDDACEFGRVYGQDIRDAVPRQTRNGFKHKAIPNFYGMLGMICKPIRQLEISAFANLIGKRTYDLAYGSFSMDQRLTVNAKVGYKPVKGVEIFFDAHNLLNSEKREFALSDEVGGLYTFGINFGL